MSETTSSSLRKLEWDIDKEIAHAMSKETYEITITIQVPVGARVTVKQSEVKEDWDVWAWGRKWEKDCLDWWPARGVDTRLFEALRRVGRIVTRRYDSDAGWVDCEPYSYILQYSFSKPYPSFHEALPMIAGRSIKVRNIGEKSIRILADVLSREAS